MDQNKIKKNKGLNKTEPDENNIKPHSFNLVHHLPAQCPCPATVSLFAVRFSL